MPVDGYASRAFPGEPLDGELRAELTELEREWLEPLRGWGRSGLWLTAYARREGPDHRRSFRLRRLLEDRGTYREDETVARRFVRAEVQLDSEPRSGFRVRFGNGCVVVPGGEPRRVALRERLEWVSALACRGRRRRWRRWIFEKVRSPCTRDVLPEQRTAVLSERRAPWEGHFSDYRRHQGMLVPSRGEVGWYADGRLEIVWKGEIGSLEYEVEQVSA